MSISDDPVVLGKQIKDPFKAITRDPLGLELFGVTGDAFADKERAPAPKDNESETAGKPAIATLSETAKRNRDRRRSASLMTQNFAIPQLSKPGLLGV